MLKCRRGQLDQSPLHHRAHKQAEAWQRRRHHPGGLLRRVSVPINNMGHAVSCVFLLALWPGCNCLKCAKKLLASEVKLLSLGKKGQALVIPSTRKCFSGSVLWILLAATGDLHVQGLAAPKLQTQSLKGGGGLAEMTTAI